MTRGVRSGTVLGWLILGHDFFCGWIVQLFFDVSLEIGAHGGGRVDVLLVDDGVRPLGQRVDEFEDVRLCHLVCVVDEHLEELHKGMASIAPIR